MPRPFSRAAALLTAVVTTVLTLGGPASAAARLPQARPAPARPSPPRARPPSRVLLITGAEVLTSTGAGGARSAAITRAPGQGLARDVQVLRFGHQTYLIPLEALPYLGHGLAPGLFEVSALARVERGGRLPVALRYQGRLHAPPGVTVTRREPGAADGYLTPAGARRFGAALARQWAADHARARFGTDGLFSGGLSITVPGVPGQARARARPDFPLHTLTVTGTTSSGRPDTGDEVEVYDMNDLEAFSGLSFFYHGVAKFSVPAGTYWALGTFTGSTGRSARVHEDVLPQFAIRGNTRVHLSARAATSQVTVATPRPARPQQLAVLLERSTRDDIVVTGSLVFPGTSLWISPIARPPSDGALHAFTRAWLTSPRSAPAPYAYTLDFPDPPGLISPDQHVVASASGLATMRSSFFQDVGTTGGGWCTAGGTVFEVETQPFMQCGGAGLRLPGRLTMYFSARPAMYWSANYWERAPFAGGQFDGFRRLYPGQDLTQDWNRYPLHPGVNVTLPGNDGLIGAVPSAARAGNTLYLDVTPFTDNTGGHQGSGFAASPVTGRYAIYQNGTRIAGGNAVAATRGGASLILRARLSPRPAVIRFVLTASRASRAYRLSAVSRDVWTWPTRRRPGATIPAPWFCSSTDFGSHCAVQGMLTLHYDVAGLSLSGATRAGRQQVGLVVGHLQHGPTARIESVRVQVSLTGGRTWRAALVRRAGPARFRAVFSAPGRSLVSLRVTARDAAGDAVTETIPRAYEVRAAAPRLATRAAPRLGTRAAPRLGTRVATALRAACLRSGPDQARCLVEFRPRTAVGEAIALGISGPAARPHGLTPRDLRSAYRLPSRGGDRQTVADVVAWNTPGLARFLARYRRQFGLPPCTTRGGCLRIVGQRGSAAHLPASGTGTGWDLEATTDVDMISAACPHCRILVVEARSDDLGDLAAAENTAARLGAPVISNSYGAQENGFTMADAKDYDHPGHTIVVSAGDQGFGPASFPASLSTVTAVGGTTLTRAARPGAGRAWLEQVWNQPVSYGGAGGSGCSAYVAKPAWQHDPHCPGRTVADTAAVASNVAVYEPYYGGWVTVGGTSVSAALIAGIYGLAGNAAHLPPSYLYRHQRDLFDITRGENAFLASPRLTCGNDYLCRARPGYDAPTGLGTPDGTGAF